MNKAIIGGIIAAVAIVSFAFAFLISPDSNTQSPTISHNEKLGLVINTPTSETTLQSLDNIFLKLPQLELDEVMSTCFGML